MSKLTLDEAIKHCLEVAERQEKLKESKYISDIEVQYCDKCAADHRQLAEWLTELKEAKRLLKAAVEDIARTDSCFLCKYYDSPAESCQTTDDCFVWRYADEALKLIGGSENG